MAPNIEQNIGDDFSFDTFSRLPFYRDVNSRLLEIANLERYNRIIDLGCGTGTVTQLILDRVRTVRDMVIYAIDHSTVALKVAMKDLANRKEAVIKFVVSEAQDIVDAIDETVDAVVYCNSIHYVPDKYATLQGIRNRLNKNGLLAINTSFFEGSNSEESIDFYRRWMMRSRRILKRDHNISPTRVKVQSRQHLTADEYIDIVTRSGFKLETVDVKTFRVPFEGWQQISTFKDWIEGVFPGVPLQKGQETLQVALRQIFNELGVTTIPRKWLSITAVKV